MPGSSATKLKAKDPKPDATTERLMRLAAAQSAAGRNGGEFGPLQPEQRKLVAVVDSPAPVPARKSGTLGRTSVIPAAARALHGERARAASAEPVAWSSETPAQRPSQSKTPGLDTTKRRGGGGGDRAPSAIEGGVAHAAAVAAEGEASQLLKHRFAAALRANGLSAGAFRELFRIPHEVPFADWAADPSARDRRCDAIALAFVHDDRGLRQHFVATCHAGGLSLEAACRILRLRLADVAAWLASSPAEVDVAAAAAGLKDQLELPPLVGPAGSTFANSGTGMLPAIWAFLLSQHRREQRAELNDASHLAVAAESAAYDTRTYKRSQRRRLGRVVTVGGVNESSLLSVGDASDAPQPSLGAPAAAGASSSMDISKLTGVFVPKPARARTLEVALPRVTSVIAESPILRHRVAPEVDDVSFPLPPGEAAPAGAIARLRDADDDLDDMLEETFEVADLRPMSPLRTVAAVAAQTAPVCKNGATPAPGGLHSSQSASKRRVVPLLVHDGEGHLKARPRRPEVLRARAKPHEKDQFRLEQAVSDLRFRRVADTYAPPSNAALDRLVTMAEELWESSSDDGGSSAGGDDGHGDDSDDFDCMRTAGAGPGGDRGDRDVPHALRHILPPRPVPLSSSPLPPATPSSPLQPGHGALDAHQSAAPGTTALDGRRVLESRDKPRALLRTPMLEGAKAKDGLRPVEYGGRRLVTPTEGALRPCERTLLRLMVDKRIRGPHAKELQTALHEADARKKRKLPPVSIGLL